jgi:hypothetical protein
VSCVRFALIVNLDSTSIDLSWNLTDTFIWSSVELNIGIVSGCLPCCRPVYNYIRTGSFKASQGSLMTRSSAKTNSLWAPKLHQRTPTIHGDGQQLSMTQLTQNNETGNYERADSQEG